MTDLKKIEQLLDSRTAENNYIALCLMLEVLDYTFEEAFAKVHLVEDAPCVYSLEIGNLSLHYKASFHKAIDVPSDWGYINREIRKNGVVIPRTINEIYVDENIAWRMNHYMELKVEEMDLFVQDFADIVPIMKRLFEEIYKNSSNG